MVGAGDLTIFILAKAGNRQQGRTNFHHLVVKIFFH